MEFRWIKLDEDNASQHRHVPHVPGGDGFYVLQVREREGPRGEDWWGDWKDIEVET